MIFFTSASALRAASPEELAQAEDTLALERSRDAALGLFARRMTHDMSNFVTVVRTYSELLLADLPATGTTHADVLEIHRAADAMVEYLHHVARFARSTGAHGGLVKLDDVVSDMVDQFNQAAPPSNPSGHASYHAGVKAQMQLKSASVIRIDTTWLVDILRELLANAREASPADGTVQVRTWRDELSAPVVDGGLPIRAGVWTVTEIADEGAGFSADVRERAVDPFVTSKHGVRGAGFGLALARSVVWHAGGQLVIDDSSHDPSPGTRVRLWIPVEPTAD